MVSIGFGGKRLLVSYANNYRFVYETTIGLRANDSCCILVPPLTTLHRLWRNALYPFEISGEKREIDHSPLGTVYLLSTPAGALSYPN